jgi:flagellar FliJ protein
MGFRFRFERLLTYRGHLKDRAEAEFGAAGKSLALARELLKSMVQERERTEGSLRAGLAKGLSAAEIKSHADYLESLDHRTALQVREVERLEALVSTRREALLARSREVKVMEQMKERDFQKWQTHQEASEQQRLNEVGIQRHGRELA